MDSQLLNILLLVLGALAFVALWAGSIAFAYTDTGRRRVPLSRQMIWIAVVALLPLVGFIIYLLARAVGLVRGPSGFESQSRGRRTTLAKPPAELDRVRTDTYPAADLIKQTRPDLTPLRAPPTPPRRGSLALAVSVVSGPHSGMEIPLLQLPASIGRGYEATIALDQDLQVSRKHAEIYLQSGVVRIRDLNSMHGTQVNGYNINDKGLDPGDRIQVGQSTLLVKQREAYS